MAEPLQLEIRVQHGAWVLSRDGAEVRQYGHADDAVHDAVRMAKEMIQTGQPAEVRLEAQGKLIQVDLTEPGAAASSEMANERSAIVPDRGTSA